MDIFINKSVTFSLDLLNVRQTLLDKPILRFMGPIKMRFWARKTHKSARKFGFGIVLDIFINKSVFFNGSIRYKEYIT